MSDKMNELKRVMRTLAAIEAFPGKRAEVLARLRIDEGAFARDEQAFGLAFANLSTSERAQLTDLHRVHTTALQREGARLEDLGDPEPETRRETRRPPARAPMPQVETQIVESVRVGPPTLPFAGQTTPDRLAVIRAAHPVDEDTAAEDGDTAVAPRPNFGPTTPWDATHVREKAAPANDGELEITMRVKRPTFDEDKGGT